MKRAAVVALLVATAAGADEDDYSTPTLGAAGFFGSRTGSGVDDAALGGAMINLGWRFTALRVGLVGRASFSRAFSSSAFDVGGYFSGDVLAVWLDPEISVGLFLRADALMRYVPAGQQVGFVPFGAVGLRAIGIEISLAAGPEFGLTLGPGGDRIGGNFEVRVGVDAVELGRFVSHRADESRQLPR